MQFGKNRQRLSRWGSLMIVVVIALSLTYCSLPSDPGVPRWNIPFAIPFATTTFGLDSLVAQPQELLDDSSGVILNDDGSLGFYFADEIPKFTISEEDLSYDMEGTELAAYDIETDTLVIPMDDTREESILIDDLLAGNDVSTDYEDGDNVLVPPFNIPTSEEEIVFDDLDSIRSAHIMENGGVIDLTIQNNTNLFWDFLEIDVQRDDLAGGWVSIGTLLYEDIEERGQQTLPLDLGDNGGTTLTPTVKLVIDGGGAGGSIELYHSDNMTFEMFVETLKCDSAYAIIPAQDPEIDSTEIALGGDDWITEAVIASGSIDVLIVNETDVSSSITLQFPDIYESDGVTVWQEDFELDRARTGEDANRYERHIDLAGFVLRLDIPEEGEEQVLTSITRVEIIGSGQLPGGEPEYSRIALGDRVYSDFQASALTFESVKLVPKALELEVESQTQAIDVFEGEEDLQSSLANSLRLEDVHIEAGFDNSFNIPVNLILNFTASNSSTGDVFVMDPVELFIESSQDTIDPIYGLEDLLNIYPDEITFSASVQAGRDFIEYDFSGDNEWGVALGDSIKGTFYLKAPLSLSIENETTLRPAPQSMSDKFEAPLQQARLLTSIRNTVPFGGTIYVLAGVFDNEADAIEQLVPGNPNIISLIDPPITLQMPNLTLIGNGIYRAESAVEDTVVSVISKEALELFEEEGVFVREVLVLNPTLVGGEPIYVAAYAEDHVEVTIVAEVEYRVNEEDTEGGEE